MDREKVIKGLELLYDRLLDAAKRDAIAMLDAKMVANAIAMLKEHEAMKECLKKKCVICPHCDNCDVDENGVLKEQDAQSVLSNRVCETEPFRYVRKGFCPKCHQQIEWLFNRKYCGFCGQAVKWA